MRELGRVGIALDLVINRMALKVAIPGVKPMSLPVTYIPHENYSVLM